MNFKVNLDGNRKEALKDFVKEVEDTIEHHILKQGDCVDQLSGFFDTKMKALLQVSILQQDIY